MSDLPISPNNESQTADSGENIPNPELIAGYVKLGPRKPPRLARILETDRLAIIVTNRRLRAGIPVDKISR